MMICLRREVAWLQVRGNRRRQVKGQTFFGKMFATLNPRSAGRQLLIKDIWAGPLVIRLEHWREVDA